MSSNFDRVREWRRELVRESSRQGHIKMVEPVPAILPMAEECGEYADAPTPAERMDAIGDMAVTAIVLYDIKKGPPVAEILLNEGYSPHPVVEDEPINAPIAMSISKCVGMIAEGLRKPLKEHQVAQGCANLVQLARQAAHSHGYDFERDCLGPVCDILEARLKEGYTFNAGTAVKKGDS